MSLNGGNVILANRAEGESVNHRVERIANKPNKLPMLLFYSHCSELDFLQVNHFRLGAMTTAALETPEQRNKCIVIDYL